MARTRQIEVDVATADALEKEAEARGLSLQDFLAEVVAPPLPPEVEAMRREGRGPWSPEALAEDQRAFEEYQRTGEAIPLEEIESWVNSWGSANELPPPKARKL